MRVRSIFVAAALTALAIPLAACGGTAATGSSGQSVTVYTADGLDGWYDKRFAEFTQQTGIAVNKVEAGSGEVVSRVDKERANPQADILVTLPPFMQRAAGSGLLTDGGVGTGNAAAIDGRDPKGRYVPIVNNYPVFIANPNVAPPLPATWNDLLDPRYKGKLQYSTPGEAGDGTAVLLQLQKIYGKQGALDYLHKLQANNVGPSSSTGKLQPKVSNGELAVANGDVQMNLDSIVHDKSNFRLVFLADDQGRKSTLSLPYLAGLTTGAPHADAARKLLEFLLSPAVQQTVGQDAVGVPVRSDVKPTDDNSAKIAEAMRGVTVWQPDWDAVARDLDTDVTAYKESIAR